ncbi:MAG: DUF3025 domain-containing protein [Rhodocyclaceae bacterium]|nr:DUF3025 domain-containing protein [Rhodocyclaceae bacterium]
MSFELPRLSAGLRRLYAPYRPLIGESAMEQPPELAEVNVLFARHRPTSAVGRPLRVVGSDGLSALEYERRVLEHGELETRACCWHDYFNALVWLVFPATKAAINRRHCEAAGGDVGRGAVRDALTQFDECGTLVVSPDADLLDGLRGHRWEATLWQQRARFLRDCRVLVIGHGTLDALRQPFPGLCAKALFRQVPADWLSRSPAQRWRDADAWLAGWICRQGDRLAPPAFSPLPLLGLPDVVADNACASYYRDSAQFRPRRAPGLGGLRCS